jgi:hypothetical protein
MSNAQNPQDRLDEIEHTPANTTQEINDQNAEAIAILTSIYNQR